ncbi:MAG: hypothetical protein ACOC1K_08130 [Nanoarchaeota archaeon]
MKNINDVDYSSLMKEEEVKEKKIKKSKKESIDTKELKSLQEDIAKGLLETLEKCEKLYSLKSSKEVSDLQIDLLRARESFKLL